LLTGRECCFTRLGNQKRKSCSRLVWRGLLARVERVGDQRHRLFVHDTERCLSFRQEIEVAAQPAGNGKCVPGNTSVTEPSDVRRCGHELMQRRRYKPKPRLQFILRKGGLKRERNRRGSQLSLRPQMLRCLPSNRTIPQFRWVPATCRGIAG